MVMSISSFYLILPYTSACTMLAISLARGTSLNTSVLLVFFLSHTVTGREQDWWVGQQPGIIHCFNYITLWQVLFFFSIFFYSVDCLLTKKISYFSRSAYLSIDSTNAACIPKFLSLIGFSLAYLLCDPFFQKKYIPPPPIMEGLSF